tara:strand:+ start:85 stop:282 length:198 start_codon:yes stop_codon:yes gene_type:complete
MSDNTLLLKDLMQFSYLLERGMMPHEAVETMIKHNQKLEDTCKYLSAMVNAIKVYQSEMGKLKDE